jgi:sulfatase modifying factor 1
MRRLVGVLVAVVVVLLASRVGRAPGRAYPPVWTDRPSGVEFILIQPGTFDMGTPVSEPGREPQEVLHRVHLTKAFYLGRYEVTQAQWTRVMDGNPSQFQDCPSCPVERVNFHDVEAFINHVNERSGGGFRLPTEAEWEYACRAGGSAPFGHQSSLSSRDANIDGNHPYNAPKGTARGETTPVGHFAANPWGLFDMSGNVWEWVQDSYCPYPEGPVTDPIGRCDSEYRVIRGGSWKFDGARARCGLRYTHRPQDSGYSPGFRLARDLW